MADDCLTHFQCPVTLETFTEPRVLTCGHTIDRVVLESLTEKVCPVCRTAFFLPPPINWVLVDAMGLNITGVSKNIDNRLEKTSNAMIMASTTMDAINDMLDVNRSLLFTKITESSRQGCLLLLFFLFISHAYPDLHDPTMQGNDPGYAPGLFPIT